MLGGSGAQWTNQPPMPSSSDVHVGVQPMKPKTLVRLTVGEGGGIGRTSAETVSVGTLPLLPTVREMSHSSPWETVSADASIPVDGTYITPGAAARVGVGVGVEVAGADACVGVSAGVVVGGPDVASTIRDAGAPDPQAATRAATRMSAAMLRRTSR